MGCGTVPALERAARHDDCVDWEDESIRHMAVEAVAEIRKRSRVSQDVWCRLSRRSPVRLRAPGRSLVPPSPLWAGSISTLTPVRCTRSERSTRGTLRTVPLLEREVLDDEGPGHRPGPSSFRGVRSGECRDLSFGNEPLAVDGWEVDVLRRTVTDDHERQLCVQRAFEGQAPVQLPRAAPLGVRPRVRRIWPVARRYGPRKATTPTVS